MKDWKDIAKGIVIGAVLMIGATVLASWSEPTAAPTGGNADAPLNVSNTGQTKAGNLVVNNNGDFANGLLVPYGALVVGDPTPTAGLKIDVSGKTGSDLFCNGTGTKCFNVDTLCQKVANLCQ